MVGTLGVDFKVKVVNVEGYEVHVQVWDTAGQERFRKITKTYYRGAHGIVLVYDTCDYQSFENVNYWLKNIKESASESCNVNILGNKIDLRENRMGKEANESTPKSTSTSTSTTTTTTQTTQKNFVTTEEGAAVGQENDIAFYETSAKVKTNVEQSFMELIEKVVKTQIEADREKEEEEGGGEEGGDGEGGAKKGAGGKKIFKKGITHATKKKVQHAKEDCVIS